METMFKENNNSLPENNVLASSFGKNQELKKYMKKVMPFAETRKQMFKKQGKGVFNQTAPFDEVKVLEENLAYLTATLELEGLDIKSADEAEAKVQEECCPLEPYVVFRQEESAVLRIINNQPYRPLFNLQLPVYEGDTASRLSSRVRRELRGIKETAQIQLMRYKDPDAGPRVIPNVENPMQGKEVITSEGKFLLSKGQGASPSSVISLQEKGNSYIIGSQIIYSVV
jgi:leucyl-tRNA synthetase